VLTTARPEDPAAGGRRKPAASEHRSTRKEAAFMENGFRIGRLVHTITPPDILVKENEEVGLTHFDMHTVRGGCEASEEEMLGFIELCRRKKWTFAINVEGRPMGWMAPPRVLAAAKESGRCLGIVFDECDHNQIDIHVKWKSNRFDGIHYFAETEGMTLDEAYEAVLQAATQKRRKYDQAGVGPVMSEHLYPAMMHLLARAGFAICPKILKETWGPLMLAAALGAARQYDRDLWVCVDEWWHDQWLGHPMNRYRSALLMAYWIGASGIVTEGGDLFKRHNGLAIPESVPASPAEYIDLYTRNIVLSQQGSIVQKFANDYAPDNPRPYTFRDVRPTAAIIRFDDTCFDTRQRIASESPGPLYGHIPAEEVNAEWLTIWNYLTYGHVRTDCLTHNWETKLPASRSLFLPLNNVVVYDHLVSEELLDGIDWLFLSGHEIPEETLQAVGTRVRAGATCLTPARFLPASARAQKWDDVTIIGDGAGRWVVPRHWYSLHHEPWTNGPADRTLREALEGSRGPEDRMQYVFGDSCLRVKMINGSPDDLEYTVVPADRFAQRPADPATAGILRWF